MLETTEDRGRFRLAQLLRAALGAIAGLTGLLLAGELFLRLAPTDDLKPYLGAASGLSGPYKPDPLLGADYKSYEAFAEIYRDRLDGLQRENSGRPIWAMFGNSFIQASGMLGDTAQAAFPDRQIFFLQRNEPLYVRIAQYRLLVDQGLRPERTFFALVPLDSWGIVMDPIAAVAVTPEGALGHKVREPDLIAPILGNSRLALSAWVRSDRHRVLPGYRMRDVLDPWPGLVLDELDTLFGELARISREKDIATSIILIPNVEQIMGHQSTSPQQAIGAAAGRHGLDFIDTTPAFLGQPDRPGLLLPDKHFTARGNKLLLDLILSHVSDDTAAAPAQ
jgi:hypothetical protein